MTCLETDRGFEPQNEDEELIFAEEAFRVDTQTKIHELMIEKGLTQKDLADRLKVSAARISQVFSDRANLTIRNVAKIFFAMGEKPRIETSPVEHARSAWSVKAAPVASAVTLHGFEHFSINTNFIINAKCVYATTAHAEIQQPRRTNLRKEQAAA